MSAAGRTAPPPCSTPPRSSLTPSCLGASLNSSDGGYAINELLGFGGDRASRISHVRFADDIARTSKASSGSTFGSEVPMDDKKAFKVAKLMDRTRIHKDRISFDTDAELQLKHQDRIKAKAFGATKRIGKMLGHHGEQGTAWIHNIQANALFSSLILVNIIVIGLETDLLPPKGTISDWEWWIWFSIQSFFTIAFLIEAALRYQAERKQFWQSWWNIFDVVNCFIQVVDTWVLMPIGHSALRHFMGVLRILRLVRLIRVFRLLRFFRDLWSIIQAMITAVCSCSWVLVVTIVIIYMFAILMTMQLGQVADEDDIVTQERWGNVGNSMFTLFVVTTGEAWYDICLDALNVQRWCWIIFVVYFGLTNLLIMNMFGSILVERVLQCTRQREAEQERAHDHKALVTFAKLFVELDSDGDGSISREELREALNEEAFRSQFYAANVCLLKDTEFLIRFWDYNASGSIEFDEFVSGVQQLRHCGNNQNLLLLHHDIQAYGNQILAAMGQTPPVLEDPPRPTPRPQEAALQPDSAAWGSLTERLVAAVTAAVDGWLRDQRAELGQDVMACLRAEQCSPDGGGAFVGSGGSPGKLGSDGRGDEPDARPLCHGKPTDRGGVPLRGPGPAPAPAAHQDPALPRKKSRRPLPTKRGERDSTPKQEPSPEAEHGASPPGPRRPSPVRFSHRSRAADHGDGPLLERTDNGPSAAAQAAGFAPAAGASKSSSFNGGGRE